MALIKEIHGHKPCWGEDCWFADNATLIGDLQLGHHCSVWFQAVIRADVNAIRIGNEVNIQDGAVLHCTYNKSNTMIGDRVSVGHNAIVHGAEIQSDVLIGMGAIIMDHAKIPSRVIIGAGAIVLEGQQLESNWIYVGAPAKKLKRLSSDQCEKAIRQTASNYQTYSRWFN